MHTYLCTGCRLVTIQTLNAEQETRLCFTCLDAEATTANLLEPSA